MVQTDNNAMTEVALALAMAFFAIFILAAVSMSQPSAQAQPTKPEANIVHDLNLQFENNAERDLAASETLLIYHKGQFLDAALQPYALDGGVSPTARFVVAVSPDLSMAEMLAIKQQKNLPNLAITLLNKEWQDRLERIK
jgi:hypothetical protein